MKTQRFTILAVLSIATICCSSCGVQGDLIKLEVTTGPSKTTYKVGETFSTIGMVVTGTYYDSKSDKTSQGEYKNYYYWCGDNEGKLRLTDTSVKITDINDYNSPIFTTVAIKVEKDQPGPTPDPGDYYKTITDDMSGDALVSALRSIISKNVTVSYDWSRYEKADEDINNSSNITTIYARTSLKKSAHVSTGNVGWNREHSFPQSKMSGDCTSDNHIIFASDAKVNGTRSNNRLGELSGSPNVKDSYGKSTTCISGKKGSETMFDPGDTIARGMVARATMYAAVLYGLNPTSNFESYDTLLKWHLNYEPEACDIKRNETVYSLQKNRNPFVDHPEYACKIWGTKSATTRSLCGM